MVNELEDVDEEFRTELSLPRGRGLRPIPVSKVLYGARNVSNKLDASLLK